MTERITKYLFFLVIAFIAINFFGCEGQAGDSYFNLPPAPKEIFRGGYGRITIKYKPPPEPIFRVQSATQYIDLKDITEKYGVPDKPFVISLQIKGTVLSSRIIDETSKLQFNKYVEKTCKGWMYTQWGTGNLRVEVNVRTETITVDPSDIMLKDAGPDRAQTKVGNPYDLVRTAGFTVVEGKIKQH
ncbi:MAG: hypothetical protein ACLFSQ_04080 [Candidatus Zixiibacteriota bacterium]